MIKALILFCNFYKYEFLQLNNSGLKKYCLLSLWEPLHGTRNTTNCLQMSIPIRSAVLRIKCLTCIFCLDNLFLVKLVLAHAASIGVDSFHCTVCSLYSLTFPRSLAFRAEIKGSGTLIC